MLKSVNQAIGAFSLVIIAALGFASLCYFKEWLQVVVPEVIQCLTH
jgi:hypothetical protein